MPRSASIALGPGRIVVALAVAVVLSPAIVRACDRESGHTSHASSVSRVAVQPVMTPIQASLTEKVVSGRKRALIGALGSLAAPQNAGETAGPVLSVLPYVPGTAGMRIELDPESGVGRGEIVRRSIVDPMRALPSLEWSSEGLVPVTLPDGSVMVDLKGRFQEYSVVRLDAAGRPHIVCVPGLDQAKKVASQPLPAVVPARAEE